MRRKLTAVTWVLVCVASLACTAAWCDDDDGPGHDTEHAARALIAAGRHTFRFDTFGDEAFWGDTLRLHQAIEGSRFGGVGAGVSPKTALAVGLKVDVDALPADRCVAALRRGQVNLDDPAVTLALLKLNAVVGVHGLLQRRTAPRCARSASSAPCATRRSTTRSRRASASASTAGPTAT